MGENAKIEEFHHSLQYTIVENTLGRGLLVGCLG